MIFHFIDKMSQISYKNHKVWVFSEKIQQKRVYSFISNCKNDSKTIYYRKVFSMFAPNIGFDNSNVQSECFNFLYIDLVLVEKTPSIYGIDFINCISIIKRVYLKTIP